ncbi:Deoxyuridine 5'-triphosphate nucleotidohydrolase [Myxozyma melibiosi]|uniref:Deoxyuridine 5'-triphosphate nucleotidohydrolase n=1 Tax=Myxozyma melibiosi TaxID=54550 RepID=A0ABR1F703_9ASCO
MTISTEPSTKKIKTDDDIIADAPPMLVKFLGPKAKMPTRGSEHAAGYDLYTTETATIPAHGRVMVATDIAIALPVGTYGRVAPRSGLATKHGIQTGAGVIDCDYRGPLKILLFNHSDVDFVVNEGDRVAQMVVERIMMPETKLVDELPETVRGEGGFGSTGGFGGK